MAAVSRWIDHARLATYSLQARRDLSPPQRQEVERRLAEQLARMHGVPQKIGQMLAPTARLTEQGREAFAQLREQKVSFDRRAFDRRLREAWHREPSQVLEWVDDTAITASFGQVYHAKLRDGGEVALKLLHPGVKSNLQTDLSLLGWLAMPFGNLRKNFRLDDYKRTLADILLSEVDYGIEAEAQSKLGAIVERHPRLRVPRVVYPWTTSDVLVSEWIETYSWVDGLSHVDLDARRELSDVLLRFYLDGLFRDGLMQADWHPGNVRFTRESRPSIALFDFGSVCRLSQSERVALVRLTEDHSEKQTWESFVALGFDPDLLEPMRAKLPGVAHLLLEPFEHDGYDLADWNLGDRISAVLGEDRWNFRAAGPPSLLSLLRSLHGVLGCLRDLGVPLQGRSTWREASRSVVSASSPFAVAPSPSHTFPDARLSIRVLRQGELKARVTLPIDALDRLDEVVEPDVMARIRRRGIDPSQIAEQSRRLGFPPGPLFELNEMDSLIQVEIVPA